VAVVRARKETPASVQELLCDCGSGKQKLSTGRCRSCASKLAAETRRTQAPEPAEQLALEQNDAAKLVDPDLLGQRVDDVLSGRERFEALVDDAVAHMSAFAYGALNKERWRMQSATRELREVLEEAYQLGKDDV